MAREAKFNFIPENQLKETFDGDNVAYRVSITSMGQLYFPREVVDTYGLKKKYFKIVADTQKKAIGWRTFEKGDSLEDLKHLKQLKFYGSEAGTIMISSLLHILDKDWKSKPRTKLPVKRFQSLLEENVTYYVELNPQEETEGIVSKYGKKKLGEEKMNQLSRLSIGESVSIPIAEWEPTNEPSGYLYGQTKLSKNSPIFGFKFATKKVGCNYEITKLE